MSVLEEKIDSLTDKVDEYRRETKEAHGKIFDKLDKQATNTARLEERTKQHEKRMDRNDRRSTAIGAGTGVAGGFLASFIKSLLGGQS